MRKRASPKFDFFLHVEGCPSREVRWHFFDPCILHLTVDKGQSSKWSLAHFVWSCDRQIRVLAMCAGCTFRWGCQQDSLRHAAHSVLHSRYL